MKQPTLMTERLCLRPFELADAEQVYVHINDERIASVTRNIPYPYPASAATEWISKHVEKWNHHHEANFAVIRQDDQQLMGAISLMQRDNGQVDIGYWLGVAFWGKGYMTEACEVIAKFGLEQWGLDVIHACHVEQNTASGVVLKKAGFQYIGSKTDSCGHEGVCQKILNYQLVKSG